VDQRVISVADRPAAGPSRSASVTVPLILAILLLAAFAVFTFVNEPAGSGTIDRFASRLSHRVFPGTSKDSLVIFAILGSPVVSVALAMFVAAIPAVRGRLLAAGMVFAVIGAFVGIEGLLRVRLEALPWTDLPDLFLHPRGRHLLDSSYPSGHVGRLVLLAGIVVTFLPARLRVAATVAVAVLGGLTAAQRVLAGSHTGSDGLGGLLLGGGLAATYTSLLPLADQVQRLVLARRT
jgi:membrane-associated phospholipid phosphatase